MRYSPLRYSLSIHEDAERDLEALWEIEEESAAIMDAFIGEAAGSQEILNRFTEESYVDHVHDPGFDIKRWQALWKKYPLWRIRLFNVPIVASAFRIVFTFHPRELRYYILGIVPRDFNYEPIHPLTKRIIRACNELGIT
jgi:anti-sigma-K factor RskA